MSIHLNDVFRYVADTDVPIPTHYFVVLTSCKNKAYTPDNCSGSLDVLPFIIPHRPTNVESCPVSVPGRTGGPGNYTHVYLIWAATKAVLSNTWFSALWLEFGLSKLYRFAIYRIIIKPESDM